jgi:hypothetical protein
LLLHPLLQFDCVGMSSMSVDVMCCAVLCCAVLCCGCAAHTGAGDATASGLEGLPPAAARALAFGTHLLLVLEALGVLYAAPHGNEGLLSATRCAPSITVLLNLL